TPSDLRYAGQALPDVRRIPARRTAPMCRVADAAAIEDSSANHYNSPFWLLRRFARTIGRTAIMKKFLGILAVCLVATALGCQPAESPEGDTGGAGGSTDSNVTYRVAPADQLPV